MDNEYAAGICEELSGIGAYLFRIAQALEKLAEASTTPPQGANRGDPVNE